jgi:hypothetical protein
MIAGDQIVPRVNYRLKCKGEMSTQVSLYAYMVIETQVSQHYIIIAAFSVDSIAQQTQHDDESVFGSKFETKRLYA